MYYAVEKWIETIAVGESCFAGRHCCYEQRMLLLLVKKGSIVKKEIIKQPKVD